MEGIYGPEMAERDGAEAGRATGGLRDSPTPLIQDKETQS